MVVGSIPTERTLIKATVYCGFYSYPQGILLTCFFVIQYKQEIEIIVIVFSTFTLCKGIQIKKRFIYTLFSTLYSPSLLSESFLVLKAKKA